MKSSLIITMMILLVAGLLGHMAEPTPSSALAEATIRVPEDYGTIQAAIDAAGDGDLVLVGPDTYNENLTIDGKSIILASHYHLTADDSAINQTIIDGGGSTTITVKASAGPQTRITGFTIQNGNDGILAGANLEIDHNRIIGNSDGLDYSGGGGSCHDNVFENNSDDGIDHDGAVAGVVENNIIQFNDDDGIEIRLHEYSGPTLNITIRDNVIHGNREDGIQLIDYPDLSDRVFYIERNLITNNHFAGLGLMDDGYSNEDYRAASIPERIYLYNNTFASNQTTDQDGNVVTGGYAVTGGDNLLAINNIFVGHANVAVKEIDGDSTVTYNLFWNNGTDNQGSNVDNATSLFADPLLGGGYRPKSGSPAIDAGTAYFLWKGEVVLDISPGGYNGSAPDMGWVETSSGDVDLSISHFIPLIVDS